MLRIVFDLLFASFGENNFALENKAFIPIATAIELSPNFMVTHIIGCGLLKIAVNMLETSNASNITAAMGLFHTLIHFEADPSIHEQILNEIEDSDITTSLEYLSTTEEFGEEATILLSEWTDLFET